MSKATKEVIMKKYISGLIGGIVGGFIASLPWILMYVYGNFLLSLLATLIAFGIAYGYKLCKGPMTKKYPSIITILALFIVIVVTLLIIPLIELYKEGYFANFRNLQLLYQNGEFVKSIMIDLAISVIFTFLGISSVVNKAKQEIKHQEQEND